MAQSKREKMIPFHLKWEHEGAKQGETTLTNHTYDGAINHKEFNFAWFRNVLIAKGIREGHKFLGELRGSQLRMPLKFSKYAKVAQIMRSTGRRPSELEIGTLILFNRDTHNVELWGRNDKFPGRVIEHQGIGYSLSAVIEPFNEKNVLNSLEAQRVEALRRVHTPTKAQTEPIEMTERELYPPNETLFQEVGGPGVDAMGTYERTGKAPIPVPTREEMDKVRRTVTVLARDDSGEMKPTAAYYAMNAIEGEIVTVETDPEKTDALIHLIVEKIQQGQTYEQLVEIVTLALSQLQGYEFDWHYISHRVKYLLGVSWPGSWAEEILFRFESEQKNELPGELTTMVARHLVDPMAAFRLADMVEPAPGGSVFVQDRHTPVKVRYGMCDQRVVLDPRDGAKFVALDRWQHLGSPSFTPICAACVEVASKLLVLDPPKIDREAAVKALEEGTVRSVEEISETLDREIGRAVLGDNLTGIEVAAENFPLRDGFIVDKTMNIVGMVKDGEIKPADEARHLAALKENYPKGPHFEADSQGIGQDQYGDPIPTDLVALPNREWTLRDDGSEYEARVKRIMAVRWWEYKTRLFLSLADLGIVNLDYVRDEFVDDTPDAFASSEDSEEIMRVADPLKRWNAEDGFYHA